jgi:hypothetical protein
VKPNGSLGSKIAVITRRQVGSNVRRANLAPLDITFNNAGRGGVLAGTTAENRGRTFASLPSAVFLGELPD